MAGMTQTRTEIIADLRVILRGHLKAWGVAWPGMEWGKATLGNSILGALECHGCNPGEELQAAIRDVWPCNCHTATDTHHTWCQLLRYMKGGTP